MPKIKLPDGSEKEFDKPINFDELASSIGSGLAKATVAGLLNGKLVDASELIETDSDAVLVTNSDDDGIEIIRHSCAHLFGHALKQLYPEAKMAIGPTIENGFYYDIDLEESLSENDLEKIELRMKELAQTKYNVVREVVTRKKALDTFKDRNEPYKIEIINDKVGEGVGSTIYKQGDWLDLCRGPHMVSTKQIGKAFKLMKVAGAYWRGDSSNTMLTRIYGTAWATEKDLEQHLLQIEEAEKRDHRKLGREMDLFHFQEEAPGAVFWHPKGWTLFQSLINYMRNRQDKAGYVETNTPDMMDKSLWETSGHWDKFSDMMFRTEAKDDKIYAIKPMNCPGAVEIFKQGLKSYRDLPFLLSEFGKVHRYEPSGALHGLMRVRAFTQDDAHIFCTEDQITQESKTVCDLILSIYKDFGFDNVRIKFSDRPEKRVGDDAIWDKAEAALMQAMEATGLEYTLNPGEGAFYGPKLEFVLRDAIGRDWQCGTLQVDLNLPGRLGATYIGEDGNKKIPVMLHRALFGSLERFTGILIEHYAGHLPFWLSPLQAVVATITSDTDEYCLLYTSPSPRD